MEKSGYHLIIVRYTAYFLVAASVIFSGNVESKSLLWLVVFLLIYIININVRMFLLKNKSGKIISLLAELIFISIGYRMFGGLIFIYYFISILDSAIMLEKPWSYIMTILFYAAMVVQSTKPIYSSIQQSQIVNVIFATLIAVSFGILGQYINEERKRKKEAQKLYDKLRLSEEKLISAYEKLEEYSSTIEELTILRERNRISREIHDSVGHTLSTLIIQLQAIPYVMNSDAEKGKKMIEELVSYTKKGVEDVRRTVKELQPTDFESFQGIFALKDLVSNYEKLTGIKIRFMISKDKWELNSDQSFTLYRILQEALSNSSRHGKAREIEISLQFMEDKLYLHIKDNGTGVNNPTPGFGLKGMNERAKSLGGYIDIYSEEGRGFEINVTIPRYIKPSILDSRGDEQYE